MRRQVLTFATFVLLLGVSVGVCAGTYSGGTGEPNNPYKIATANDLNDIGNHVEDFNKCFVLVNDINLTEYTGTVFTIIGPNFTNRFTGVFDGNGHTISNFSYTSPDRDLAGLFGAVSLLQDNNVVIKDLTVIDPNVDVGSLEIGVIGGLKTIVIKRT